MTVVIADSSPLNYLTLIGSVDVLYRLYGTVVVPQQVIAELIDQAAPHEVRRWASNLPDWIDVRLAIVDDDDMPHLDPGERAAIVLAQSEPGALLLIDETAGRIEASRLGIRNTGNPRCAASGSAQRLRGSTNGVGAAAGDEFPRLHGTGDRAAC